MPTQYQPNIPTGTVNLDQDYINIRNNFSQLNTTYGSDHVAYDVVENNGYHRTIHIVPRSPDNDPNTIAGIAQLYSRVANDGYDTDTVLYFKTGPASGTGDKIQLTSNFEPVAAVTGKTFLPGGIIVQWGSRASAPNFVGGQNGSVTFPTAFATSCFKVFVTLSYSSLPNKVGVVAVSSLTTTQFSWQYNGENGVYDAFQWIAIGK